MPSWSTPPSFPYIGIKVLIKVKVPTIDLRIQGIHFLSNSPTGQPLASMDGTELTLYRTSCVFGLASKFLARPDSQVLLMVDAGAMAPHLNKAYLLAVPSLRKVMIWNQTVKKVRKKMQKGVDRSLKRVSFKDNDCLDENVGLQDTMSYATNSEVALVK